MSNTFGSGTGNYLAESISVTKENDGSFTYTARIPNVPVTWGTYSCTATVNITVTTPDTMPLVSTGDGTMFRPDTNGGYAVHIVGTDFS